MKSVLAVALLALTIAEAEAAEAEISLQYGPGIKTPYFTFEITSGNFHHNLAAEVSVENIWSYLQLQQLRQIAANSALTTERIADLNPLAERVEALAEQIRILNEEQLVAIQRAIVTRLDTIPLEMINDESVASEIRRLAIEAVESEFDVSRRKRGQ